MTQPSLSRRRFIQSTAVATGAFAFASDVVLPDQHKLSAAEGVVKLPEGNAPPPVVFPHFPSRLHAFVWRNWQLVPIPHMAKVVGAEPDDISRLGAQMGLQPPPPITPDQQRRSYITVLRRNWHLLPYDQLLELLDWTPEQLAYTLQYDDGVFWKFGSLKPKCERLTFVPETEATRKRSQEISKLLTEEFPTGAGGINEPLFHFVSELSAPLNAAHSARPSSQLTPRFCYSYFTPFGDPLLDSAVDPYPEGYLARLAETGVDGVWLHVELSKLAPFPWDPKVSERYQERLKNLRTLIAKTRRFGIGVYLYLNEPKMQPLAFFETHPQLKGIDAANPCELGNAALCTSVSEVQHYLTNAVASVCREAPDLAGFFTITASEALTNCWSHGDGSKCPRCSKRSPAEVITEVNTLFFSGIRQAESRSRLIVWDWGWDDDWAEKIIKQLPDGVSLMSPSEWSIPIERGGVKTEIGEYSISVIGPGPRALRNWERARRRGLKTIAKIQANNTWELSAVPYVPAVENVARHFANLRAAKIDGVMLGWSLGGYPSPNLEVIAELSRSDEITPEDAMKRVAERRFGPQAAPGIIQAWRECSVAFSEFPFGSGLYNTPTQFGPANLLWSEPTHYSSGPVAFPYDDLDGWRTPYPPEVFIHQFEKMADGFETTLARLKQNEMEIKPKLKPQEQEALAKELSVIEAAALHLRSVANQTAFVWERNCLTAAKSKAEAQPRLDRLETLLKKEIAAAQRLYAIQLNDSRIGFEASNHYYYVPLDLVEKVLNCRDLLNRSLPRLREKWKE